MKRLVLLFFTLAISSLSVAQLTGTKNILGNYADLAAHITDLNTVRTDIGGDVINLFASNPQTAPANGYAITTHTGTFTPELTYCTPTYSAGGSTDFITQVTLGTLSQATASNVSPYYIDYTSTQNAIPNLVQGYTYSLSLTFSSDGNQYNGVWLDFNQDGTFASSEFFTSNTNAGSNGTVTVSILVPGDATLGNTRMRIRGGDDTQPTATQACGASNSDYGQAQDYLVNITVVATPILSVVPTSLNFGTIPSGSTSPEQTYSLSGLYLTPASGDITITPPSNFLVATISGGPYGSVPITVGYTGGTLSAKTIYVVFQPSSPSTVYSGNISNAGGGAPTVNMAVSGTSTCVTYTLPFSESFNGTSIPSCWTQTYSGEISSNRWSVSATNSAGGTSNEMMATWTDGIGISRLITPAINTTGVTSLLISFNQFFDATDAGITYKIQSSADGVTWTDEAWSNVAGTENSGPENVSTLVVNNLGAATYIAWVLDGDHYQFDFWYIDDASIAPAPATKTLNLEAFLEGLYNGAGGMNQANDQLGPHFGAGIADQVTVELRNSTTGALEYSTGLVNISTTGIVTASIPATYSGSYYLYVKHRNSITTSTASPVSFAGSTINYDFTTAANKAYGDNMKNRAGVYVFYVGDVNHDGIVDGDDLVVMDPDIIAGASGYLVTDLNGDGIIDGDDLVKIDPNIILGVGESLPF